MKIGINLLWLVPGYGGLETHARGLLAGLACADRRNQYVLFTNPQNDRLFANLPSHFTRRLCTLPLRSRVGWRVAEQLLLSRYAAEAKLDVLHCPDDMIPLGRICPTVVTIHDVNFYSLADKLPSPASRLFEFWVKRAASRADAVITVSEFSRTQISTRLRIPASSISVIHNAPAARDKPSSHRWPRLTEELGISGHYIVTFADGSPHKNLSTLLRSFALANHGRRLQLLVVGRRDRQGRTVLHLIKTLALHDLVKFTGYLSDADLSLVLSNARFLAFPSLCEGFGLPVVEAMAAGVPVACSRSAALPEVAGQAAVFFDPLSVTEMATAFERLLTDESLCKSLIAAGYQRTKRLSWNRAALETLVVYNQAAESRTAETNGYSELQVPDIRMASPRSRAHIE